MMGPDGVTRENLEQQPFIDRHWLFYNGPLRRDTVLEYFALSKFYDRRSSNEELRMQGLKDIRPEHMMNMVGVQYYAEEVEGLRPEQPIFIVYKVLRASRHKQTVLDVFYVMDGMVYQAPTILSVLRARLRRCAYMLSSAHNALAGCVDFSMDQGETYGVSAGEGEGEGGGEGETADATAQGEGDGREGEGEGEEAEGEAQQQGEVEDGASKPSPKGPPAPHPENAAVLDKLMRSIEEQQQQASQADEVQDETGVPPPQQHEEEEAPQEAADDANDGVEDMQQQQQQETEGDQESSGAAAPAAEGKEETVAI